ncbi:MAG: GNAT family N-acetyltransferase [Chloroflexi bacterium]|nr:GNAT family N-acetyltransferase [Chloroflexota bacterium]
MKIRRLEPADIRACERILRALPEWFGIEESNRAYIRDLDTLLSYVAIVDGEVAGFLSLKHHFPTASEIDVLAVERSLHRRGVGRALVERAEAGLRAAGVALLEVKTLGPSNPDEGYRKTREFYTALGFLALEETATQWGPDNPSLIMVKVLGSRT